MVQLQLKQELKWHCNTILIWMKNEATFIAFENGFHGDTFGAMSVSGLSVYNGPFEDFLMDVKRIPVPNEENHQEILNKLSQIVSENKVAGFIYEPIIQGAAGMKIHDAKGLNEILEVL